MSTQARPTDQELERQQKEIAERKKKTPQSAHQRLHSNEQNPNDND